MKVNVDRTSGIILDWLTLKAESGIPKYLEYSYFRDCHTRGNFRYSSDMALATSIMWREQITVQPEYKNNQWSAYFRNELFNEDGSECFMIGLSPMEAIVKTHVKFVLGDIVEIPDEFQEYFR